MVVGEGKERERERERENLLYLKIPPTFNHKDSTLMTLTNPNHLLKVSSLTSTVGLCYHPLNNSQRKFNFSMSFRGVKQYSNHSISIDFKS
jgi:hypothetical protein